MNLRGELQRLRKRLADAQTDVWADPRNQKDVARAEVAGWKDPAALREYDKLWPTGIPGGIPSLYAWGYCARTPGAPPWEALREHVQVTREDALGAVAELQRLPTDALLDRLDRLRVMDLHASHGWGWGSYRSPTTQVLVAVLEGRGAEVHEPDEGLHRLRELERAGHVRGPWVDSLQGVCAVGGRHGA